MYHKINKMTHLSAIRGLSVPVISVREVLVTDHTTVQGGRALLGVGPMLGLRVDRC